MNSQISGVVEAVGDKFNGSLKVGGKWYANKKGFKNPAKNGDTVTLELTPWEFDGKTGVSITGVSVKETTTVAAQKAEKAQPSSGRDFDAENRGKVRHGLVVALMPMIAQALLEIQAAKNLVNEVVEFVMTGK